MNKKIFAALASATMALSATGSLAVFAEDFDVVEEANPTVAPSTPAVKPAKVLWNEDNFGSLVDICENDPTVLVGVNAADFEEGKEVKADDLKKVTRINLDAVTKNFNDVEIKGLEYFTGLTSFNSTQTGTYSVNIINTSLDFSENTDLTTIALQTAPYLRNVVLPEANDDDEYSLNHLEIDNSQITEIDLSKQTGLTFVAMINGLLKNITLPTNAKNNLETLYLQDNMVDSLNLKNFKALQYLNIDKNNLGMLDLTGTTVSGSNLVLGGQTIYVSEDAATVELEELFPDFNYNKAEATEGKFKTDKNGLENGSFELNTNSEGAYTYNVNATGKELMTVKFVAANPMNRLYNPNSGEHFYTADLEEKDALVSYGWKYEGYGWVAPSETDAVTNGNVNAGYSPVYRLYNPNAGDHHYTKNIVERNGSIVL